MKKYRPEKLRNWELFTQCSFAFFRLLHVLVLLKVIVSSKKNRVTYGVELRL